MTAIISMRVAVPASAPVVAVMALAEGGDTLSTINSTLPGVFHVRAARQAAFSLRPPRDGRMLDLTITCASRAPAMRCSLDELGPHATLEAVAAWIESNSLAVLSPGQVRAAAAFRAVDVASNPQLFNRGAGGIPHHPAAGDGPMKAVNAAICRRRAGTNEEEPAIPHGSDIASLLLKAFAGLERRALIEAFIDFGSSSLALIPSTDANGERQNVVGGIWNCMPDGPLIFGFAEFASRARAEMLAQAPASRVNAFLAAAVIGAESFILTHGSADHRGQPKPIERSDFHYPRRSLSPRLREELVMRCFALAEAADADPNGSPDVAERRLNWLVRSWVGDLVFPMARRHAATMVWDDESGSNAREWRRLELPVIDTPLPERA
jgi:hypothetical protein